MCDAAKDDHGSRAAAAGLRAIIAGRKSEFTLEYPCHGPEVERWFKLRATRFEGSGPVVSLARAFDLKTVAQDVEGAQTLALLERLGVDFAQGYHIAKPGPIEDLPATASPFIATKGWHHERQDPCRCST